MPLTAEQLGKILGEEFARDNWGVMDPSDFAAIAEYADSDLGEEAREVRKVLERVVKRLNKRRR